MAKMFYTVEEVCQKLGRTEEEILDMARTGQLQEFRDRDKLMFKVEQIDLLAGDEDTGDVHLDLDASSGASGLGLKDDTHIGLADSREGSGISVFDTDHGIDDESEQTAVGDTLEEDLTLEAVGSGSGLLDLTRESDDTSLGAELLEEVYSGDEAVEMPANASGLFEAAGADSAGEQMASPAFSGPVIVETYDGTWSGATVGMMIGAIAALVCVAIVVVVGVSGATPDLAMKFAGDLYVWLGGLAGVWLIAALVGFFIGKASE